MIKLMIVDDNEDIITMVSANLKSIDSNYSISVAKNGKECIDKLSKEEPDVILMDIMMPVMDGADAAMKIKEDPKTRDIPIIFLTAKTDKLSKNMGNVVGQDYVEKPFEINDLDDRIKSVLEEDR